VGLSAGARVLNRLGMLLRSALRAFLAPAEDPRGAAPEPLDRLEALLMQIRGALAATESARRNLEAKGAQFEARRGVMEDQARRALLAGRQDLAHVALERCRAAERERGALDPHVEAVRQEERRLGLMEQQLVARIESLDTHHAVVAARYNAAQAQVHLSEALAGISADLAGLRAVLERTERETEQMESRAAAIDRLVDSGTLVADASLGGAALDGNAASTTQPDGHPGPGRQTGAADL
jgi:phage shock protein A